MKEGKLRSALKFLTWCAAFALVMLMVGSVTALALLHRYQERASKYDLTKIDVVPERSAIYDARGEHYSYFGGENRIVVPLSAVSKNFLNALIAREDSRFWQHPGVDWRGVVRAVLVNVRAGETKQGASTITQQLARNACELRERSFDRKALEAALAYRIEKTYTKEQILELYVNRIYFGSSYQGIEAAARGYFGKPASDLTLAEAATIAALIRNPKRLSPRNQFEAAWEARNTVIDQMRTLDLVSEEDALAAKAQQIKLAQTNVMRATDDDITDAVFQELDTLIAPETIQMGGLKVYTTIDPQLQRLAQAAADRRLTEIEEAKGYSHPKKRDFVPAKENGEEKQTDYLQAAVVAIDNRTGAIRAAVGGRDYLQSKYSRALQGKRQVGSTFKPFVYAAAFERGLLPGSLVDDAPIRAGEFRDVPKNWSPENSDDEYGGPTPAMVGLLKSRNTMSVRVGEMAGLSKVRELAQSAGISDSIPDYPVVFLGGFEATPRDIAGAYTIFPNLGIYRQPYLISKIEDRDGHALWTAASEEKRVLSPDTAWLVSTILEDVMKSGTAAKAKTLGWKKIGAGKTGTTNDVHDAWFVGYSSSLTCAVWVGLDRPQTITAKGYGATLALPVWVDFMQQIQEQEYPAAPFTPPVQLAKVTLCSASGLRATSQCIAHGSAYVTRLPASRMPTGTCPVHPDPDGMLQPFVNAPGVVRPTPYPVPATPSAPAIANTARLNSSAGLAPTPYPAPLASAPVNRPPVASAPPPIAEYAPREASPSPHREPTPPPQITRTVPPAADPSEADERAVPSPATTVQPRHLRRSQPLAENNSDERDSEALPPEPFESGPAATPFPRRIQKLRRALPPPVERFSREDSPMPPVNAAEDSEVSPHERIIVERLPDGRTRTTTIRRSQGVRDPDLADLPEAREATPSTPIPVKPPKRKFRLFGDDDDD